jgi:hypothetical protein
MVMMCFYVMAKEVDIFPHRAAIEFVHAASKFGVVAGLNEVSKTKVRGVLTLLKSAGCIQSNTLEDGNVMPNPKPPPKAVASRFVKPGGSPPPVDPTRGGGGSSSGSGVLPPILPGVEKRGLTVLTIAPNVTSFTVVRERVDHFLSKEFLQLMGVRQILSATAQEEMMWTTDRQGFVHWAAKLQAQEMAVSNFLHSKKYLNYFMKMCPELDTSAGVAGVSRTTRPPAADTSIITPPKEAGAESMAQVQTIGTKLQPPHLRTGGESPVEIPIPIGSGRTDTEARDSQDSLTYSRDSDLNRSFFSMGEDVGSPPMHPSRVGAFTHNLQGQGMSQDQRRSGRDTPLPPLSIPAPYAPPPLSIPVAPGYGSDFFPATGEAHALAQARQRQHHHHHHQQERAQQQHQFQQQQQQQQQHRQQPSFYRPGYSQGQGQGQGQGLSQRLGPAAQPPLHPIMGSFRSGQGQSQDQQPPGMSMGIGMGRTNTGSIYDKQRPAMPAISRPTGMGTGVDTGMGSKFQQSPHPETHGLFAQPASPIALSPGSPWVFDDSDGLLFASLTSSMASITTAAGSSDTSTVNAPAGTTTATPSSSALEAEDGATSMDNLLGLLPSSEAESPMPLPLPAEEVDAGLSLPYLHIPPPPTVLVQRVTEEGDEDEGEGEGESQGKSDATAKGDSVSETSLDSLGPDSPS